MIAPLPSRGADGGAPAPAGSSFYTAMRILPQAQREAMYAVYAYCRAVDDIADGTSPPAERLARLDDWRADLDRLYGSGGEQQAAAVLRPHIEKFGLKKADFLAVIDGMEMDVRALMHAPGWDELDLYCDRVASAVGRLSARIFGLDDANGVALSHHLGRALQMTNILRDLDEDAAMNRLYMPREALDSAGIAPRQAASVIADPALDGACRIVAARARGHFHEASRIMRQCPRRAVRSPRLMAAVYRGMLDKLEARGWSPPRQPIQPSKSWVVWTALRHGIL